MEPDADKPHGPPPPHEDQADYEAASQSTADFVKNIGPVKEARRKRRIRRIVMAVIGGAMLLGAAGYGAYRFINRPDEPEPKTQTAPQTSDTTEKKAPSKTFKSTALGLSLQHPSDWTVDDSVPTELSISSPLTKLSDANGKSVNTKVVLSIRQKDGLLPGFEGESAKAIIESQKIAYTSPATGQRAQTYLSFLSFGGSSALDVVYITGDKAHLANAVVPKVDILSVDPTVKLQFYPCNDQTCAISDIEPIGISTDAWNNDATLQAALEILKSLSFQ